MVIQIPLSISGPVDAFAAAVETHRADLVAHRRGRAGVPVPVHNEALIDSLIRWVPRGDPYPDECTIAPYEIVDDGPTLAERKGRLEGELFAARTATVDAILSPARVRLLDLDMTDALGTPEESRTPAQVGAIAAYVAFQARAAEIHRNMALAALEIEGLDAVSVATWKVPSL